MTKLHKFLTLLCLVCMAACSPTPVKRDPAYAAVRPIPVAEAPRTDGAIFNVSNNVSYFEDYRARRVGDILTVQLDEKTTAEKESATKIAKSNNNSVTTPTLMGAALQFNAPGFIPLDSNVNNNGEFALSSKHDFDGAGDSDQSNKLTGDITVSVVEVLSNGNLVIRGEKVMTINQGNEYIRIGGIISPRDIDADNTISSKRIADVQMSYVGDGPTSDANVTGWLSNFFLGGLMPF